MEDIPNAFGNPHRGGFDKLQLLISSSRRKPYHLMKAMKSVGPRSANVSEKSSNASDLQQLSDRNTVHSLRSPPALDDAAADRLTSRLQRVRLPNTSNIEEPTQFNDSDGHLVRSDGFNRDLMASMERDISFRKVHLEKESILHRNSISEKIVIVTGFVCAVLLVPIGVFIVVQLTK